MAEDSHNLTKKYLEELLRPVLEAEGTKIEDFSIKYLTKPGDNYGSTMLAVDVILTPGPRTLPLVAKMLPKSTFLQELFKCEKTVRKETDFYLLVRPAYERIQKENNVPEDMYLNIFPVCYGARISSRSDLGPVDETSVILQENLKTQGFECADRYNGLNLAHCVLVVDKLARFHATAIAIKIKKADIFEKNVLQAATFVSIDNVDFERVEPVKTIPEYETLKERINPALLKSFDLYKSPKPPRKPFATLTHLDVWTSNIMFQYASGSSKDDPVSLRLVDFQLTQYDSPARDLLFFLYTSAHLDVLSEHYDYLVKLYYDNFVDCLSILGCDTAPFSFDEFLKEMDHAALMEFFHIAFMLPLINLDSDEAHSTDDLTRENFNRPRKIGKTYLNRARKFVLDFAARNWI